jgi:predicted nucleic acid-binding Zn ribbon protein
MTDDRPADDDARDNAMDLVRRTLEEARRAARAQGKDVGQGRRATGAPRITGRRERGGRRRWSGPGPDPRDPQLLGPVSRELAGTRGWSGKVAEGTVFGSWRTVVGDQIADHASPTGLREGVLSVSAETTAWATQLRMMQHQLLAKIAEAVGDGVVTMLKITGPTGPTWRLGPRHVPGRGPRDTYG